MKVYRLSRSAVGLGLFVSFAPVATAGADEVKVFTARAIATVLSEIGTEFDADNRPQARRHLRLAC